MNFDISGLWRIITGAVGTNYPMRLGIGIAFACLSQTVVRVLARINPDVVVWQTLNDLGTIWYLIIITPLMFLTVVFGKRGAPEGAVQQINTIRALIAEGNFSSAQRVMIWRSLVEKYLNALQPDLSSAPRLKPMFDEVSKDFTPDAGS
jgi:hypothetical protein